MESDEDEEDANNNLNANHDDDLYEESEIGRASCRERVCLAV